MERVPGPIEQELMDRFRMLAEFSGGGFPPNPDALAELPVEEQGQFMASLNAEVLRTLAVFAQYLDHLSAEVAELKSQH